MSVSSGSIRVMPVPKSSVCRLCKCPLEVESASGLCDTCVRALDPTQAAPATPDVGVLPVPFDSNVRESVATISHHAAGGLTTTGTPVVAGSTSTDVSASSARARARMPLAPVGYDLVVRLGGGGMGDVYLAREKHADRLVAMKFLRLAGSPGRLERFLTELRALAAFDHPHIVRVLASDLDRVEPYLTTEFAGGGTLGEWVETHGPLDPREAAGIMVKLARAVAAVHEQKLLHRDLKPSNILLVIPGKSLREVPAAPASLADVTPKIADFGLAKLLDVEGITASSVMVGTPSYMPPEQITTKNGELGPAADVYGLGATLYDLLTGQPPFGRGEKDEVLLRVLNDSVPRPRAVRPEVPLELDGIVVKCLEKDPAHRYSSALSLAEDLEAFLSGKNVVAPRQTFVRRTRRWAGRHRLRLATTSLLLAAGVAIAAIRPWREKEAVPPLVEIRKELAAGKSQLLGSSGKPRHMRWLIGTAAILEPTEANPEFAFEAPEPTAIELLADPGVEKYSLSGEFQLRYHKAIVDDGGNSISIGDVDTAMFGLFCGDSVLQTVDDNPVRLSLISSYRDYHSSTVRAQMPNLKGAAQLQSAVIYPFRGGLTGSAQGAGGLLSFPLVDSLPAPWRRLRLDMTRDGLTMYWAAAPMADWQFVSHRSALELSEDLNTKSERIGIRYTPHERLVWNPAAPCGIWCKGAAIAVRNVSVEVIR